MKRKNDSKKKLKTITKTWKYIITPHAAKKTFKEYFLEFLMIFLAVTLGFFAENIREHNAETTVMNDFLKMMDREIN